MVVNYPLSKGLGNIAKVYLITCSQSTCAKLKKYEFCPEGHGGIAHIYNFCVEVFEKTISRTEMIDHSFENKFNEACYRLFKN